MHKFASFASLCALLLAHCVLPAQSTICWIEPSKDFQELMPLILKGSSDEFIYPNKCGSRSLRVTFIDNLRAACPADTINVLGYNTNLAETKISCLGITLFGLGSYVAPFRNILCNFIPVSEVQATNVTCVNGTISRVGFAISSTSFVPTIEEICVNSTTRTQWTHHKVVPGLTKSLIGGGIGNNWWSNDIWGGLFQKWTTTTTTTQSPTVGTDLIAAMMVPREDMFYRAQQDSVTTALINSVPMFNSVRNGNWRLIEDIVRKLASTKKQCATFDVWTGRYDGNSTIATRQSRQLTTTTSTTESSTTTAASETNTAPKFVIKMVVDKTRNRGLAFVTLSDPTTTAITSAQQLCTPYARCSELYPQFSVVSRGYTHCCTLADFATVATEIGWPTFPNAQTLF